MSATHGAAPQASSLLTQKVLEKIMRVNMEYQFQAKAILGTSSQVYDKPTTSSASAIEQLKANEVTTIVMDGLEIDQKSGVEIAEALATNTSVKRLRLTECAIGDHVASAIAKALRTNSTLTDLQLGTNAIGNAGLAALGRALRENTGVSHFAIRYNDFSDDGAARFFTELLQRPANTQKRTGGEQLRELSFCRNEFGDLAASALARLLLENLQLSQVNAFDNQITDDGAKAIAAALGDPRVTCQVVFSRNKATRAGVEAVENALRSNPAMEHVRPFSVLRKQQRDV